MDKSKQHTRHKMKRRYLVKQKLHQLEKEHQKEKPRLAEIIHQIGQLVDPQTSLNEEQFIEMLHLLDVEVENGRSVGKVVPQMATLIGVLYLTHLIHGDK